MAVHHMFPEEWVRLNKEVMLNPALRTILGALPANADLSDKMCEIAAFCLVEIDAYLNEEELTKLMKYCADQLEEERITAHKNSCIAVIDSNDPWYKKLTGEKQDD